MAVSREANTGSRREKPLNQKDGWRQYTESSFQVDLYNSWDFGDYSWGSLGVIASKHKLNYIYIYIYILYYIILYHIILFTLHYHGKLQLALYI